MQAAMACPCPHGRAERPANDPRHPSRAVPAHSVDRHSAAESYYANCDSTDAPAERCAHPDARPAHSTPGSARPSAAEHQPPPGAPRHRPPPPQRTPHPSIRRHRVISPRPTERLPESPDLQGFPYAPEWTRTTTENNLHKALNLVHGCKIRPPASRSSVLCGIADASGASDKLTWARDGSRRMALSRQDCPIISHPLGGAVRVPRRPSWTIAVCHGGRPVESVRREAEEADGNHF
jgi:hypothetical protein